ncbi:hypothetical protein C8F01DRAFT_1179268 [Mycena amicta]|nr:hypothetical protein C8F01DRAFT_1179268 [Mycena amicta]
MVLIALSSILAHCELTIRFLSADSTRSRSRINSPGREGRLPEPDLAMFAQSHQPRTGNTRLDTVVQRISSAVEILDILNNLGAPFVDVICATMRALITSAQNIKRNKNECAELLESTHQLLQAILALHIKADTKAGVPAATLSPSALNHLGKFVETLHKLHHFIEAQQDRRQLRQFLTFRQGETAVLLKQCRAGLQAALDFFLLERSDLLNAICELQRDEQNSHEKLLLLLNSSTDDGHSESDAASSIQREFMTSSQSFSMLPSQPKIFHGRETEINDVLSIFSSNASPRITILGAGGMGKTSLAKSILHHPDISKRFAEHRHFIPCDTVSTKIELAALLADHLEVKSGMKARDRTRVVVKYLTESPPTVLVLDNLETVWEPQESRADVEGLLGLLAEIEHLALIVTMRGAERPAQVQWTRPFLPILKPLSDEAAHQTFIDIADDIHVDDSDLRTILDLTNKMPLAVTLIAHLSADEGGCSAVLARWDHERTSLLSSGIDKRSNLDMSIALSLSSPRMTSQPGAQALLSLLSILPDGLSDIDLTQSNASLLSCKSALLRTSLAYIDDHARLQVLIPIREYMHRLYSPSEPLIAPLRRHFQALLDVYQTYRGTVSQTAVLARISSDFGNIQSVLYRGLHCEDPEVVAAAISSACILDMFSLTAGKGQLAMIHDIEKVLPTLNTVDHQLKAVFYTRFLNTWRYHPIQDPEAFIRRTLEHCEHFDDTGIKCRLYLGIGAFYHFHDHNPAKATSAYKVGLELAISSGDTRRQSDVLDAIANVHWMTGRYSAGRKDAAESQELATSIADLYREARGLHTEAMCCRSLGMYPACVARCQRARELLALCGLANGEVDHANFGTLAEVLKDKSEYTEVRRMQCLISEKISMRDDPFAHALAMLNVAEVDVHMGAPREEVERNIDAARSIQSAIGYMKGGPICDMVQGDLELREGAYEKAKLLLQTCTQGALGEDGEIVTYCLERLGNSERWAADWPDSWTFVFLAHVLKSEETLGILKALQYLGDIFLAQGDATTAGSLYRVALDGFTRMDVHRGRAECLMKLGDIAIGERDLVNAETLWRDALPLLQTSSQEKTLQGVRARLEWIGDSAPSPPSNLSVPQLV